MRDEPAPGDPRDDPKVEPQQIATRTEATAVPPLITAPMTVERPPRAGGGPAAARTGLDDTLRKPGLVRGVRLLRALNQESGFVCPGCAWPSPDARARLEACESGVRAVADEAGLRRAEPRLFATYTIPELARRSDHWLGSQGRLTEPLIRRRDDNAYTPIPWDEALALIGEELAAARDRALLYGSARVSNEAAFVWRLLADALGARVLSSSQLCHEGSRVALGEVLGEPRASVGLADLERAEAIFLFGCNPGSNHPRMLASLRAARQRGAAIVAVNPLREASLIRARDPRRPREWLGEGVEIASLLMPVAIAGDLAAIVGIAKAVLELGADPLEREGELELEGRAAYEAALAAWDWPTIVARSGLDEAMIREAADIYARSRATIIAWGTGLTQHREGVATIEQLLSLLAVRGNLGKPGAGPLALLGHSNTAGHWTVGAPANVTLTAALEALRRGEIDVLMSLGGNLLSAAPDTEGTAAALRRCRLSVHVATKLNRAHLITGETGLILPCLARSEVDRGRWLSFEDLAGTVRASVGRLAPASASLRSEVEIITGIAAAAVPEADDWASLGRDYERVRERIAATIPGCEGFAAELGRARSLRLRRASPGRAKLVAPGPPGAPLRGPEEFLLTTVRSHDQHNSTIYGYGDRERGIAGYRRVVLINLGDLRRLEIEPFEQIDLVSRSGGRERLAPRWVAVPHHIPAGMLAAYWPEANVLIPSEVVDPRSGVPASKSVVVEVRRRP